jgi:hypothetical protein
MAVYYPERRVLLLMKLNQHELIADIYNPFDDGHDKTYVP